MFTHTLGFPRIGQQRELKKSLEAYWKGEIAEADLQATARELRERHWRLQQQAGIDFVAVNDFSLYDHVLDTSVMLGAVPPRFAVGSTSATLAIYFRMARGEAAIAPLEMSKWFDTNYHYLVPEFSRGQQFSLQPQKLLEELAEAEKLGLRAKPVLLGPVTYLKLGKSVEPGFDRFAHLDAIVTEYEKLLRKLDGKVQWLQLDEPALVLDLSETERDAYEHAYRRLRAAAGRTKILLATYFEALRDNLELAISLETSALHIDLVRAPGQLQEVARRLRPHQSLSLGIVDGRNIWRVDATAAMATVQAARQWLGSDRLMIAPSCSLLHVPIDLSFETQLDPEIRSWLAFARQKCQEVKFLADAAEQKIDTVFLAENRVAWSSRRSSVRVTNPSVRQRTEKITAAMSHRTTPYTERKVKQQARLKLPLFPTTTIGSFPQTTEIRKARSEFNARKITREQYVALMQESIRLSVDRQHELGLDVLVHGEAERNDMVEYFGQQLEGICFTQQGWVQSYGSRCVKPPVIYGDVSRREPMTVEWTRYAQSLTSKPMKGMLTGPVTILCWSFVRDDQPRRDTCQQISLAIRDEVSDLEHAGISIIQVDEAALREGLPLRKAEWDDYLAWAVECFRLSTSGITDETQLHTHMCYSEFNDIVPWIAQMDADVISVEASRSRMELLEAFERFKYPSDIGPGVYDIHSPRVPSAAEIESLLTLALEVIPAERLWVNPDCGLKTRGWPETMASLRNMVEVARQMRALRA